MPSETQNFERRKLYEEIWAEAVSKVAKRYQISDVGLRKICVKLAVPVPPAGYWAKIAAGQIIKKPPLAPTKGATTHQRTVYKDPEDDERSMRIRARIDEDVAHAPEVPAIALRTSIDECLPVIRRIESPRILRRLQLLREWSNEQEIEQVFPGSPGARSTPGA